MEGGGGLGWEGGELSLSVDDREGGVLTRVGFWRGRGGGVEGGG